MERNLQERQCTTIEGYRLSPQQERLWLLCGAAESTAYRVTCTVTINGCADTARIDQALRQIIRRHEILRTEFVSLKGMSVPLQTINETGQVEIEFYDLGRSDAAERKAMIESAFVAERDRVYSYERNFILQVRLFQASDNEQTLIISLPAMYSDPAGLRNLIRELADCLSDTVQISPCDEPLQYADYSQIFHELLESEETKAGKDYWAKQVIPSGSNLKLPFEIEAGGNGEFAPGFLTAPFSAKLTKKAKAMAQHYGISVSAFLLGCWQVLLGRLTDQPEIVIGLTCDGRTYEGMSEAIGLFAKNVPFVGIVQQNHSFHELLIRTAESMRDAYRYQEYFSWEQQSQPDAPVVSGIEASSLKYFPICFEFEEQAEALSVGAFTFRIERESSITERYQLKLKCERRGEDLQAEFIYDTQCFARGAIKHLAEQYLQLVASAAEHPGAPLRELSLVSPRERTQLLEEWNRTAVEWGAFRPLHQWFEAQAAWHPHLTAVEDGSESLSYQELNERANRLARRLRQLGVGPEALVGVRMERGWEIVVALLSVLKAGGAYLPMDASYPAERLNFLVADAGVKVILTQERLSGRGPEREVAVVCVDREWERIAEESGENLGIEVEEENLAYVIYTSGSTGRPKGVMITQRGLRNYLKWSEEAYPLRAGEGSLLHSPLGFDLTVTALYPALLSGGRLRVVAESDGVGKLVEELRKERELGLVKLTPAHLEVLNQWLPVEEMGGRTKALVIGGEALYGEQLKLWQSYAPGTRLINEYGPTETVVGCCVYEVKGGERLSGGVPIGRPIANTQLYILDEQQRVVGVGEKGELYIGGAGVARGYLGRAEETAERFVPDPYGEAGGRLYRTGDVARYRWDGEIEYVGRGDDQVKVRGYRIELGEIEAVLRGQEGVGEAAAVMREDGGERRIVAYVTEEKRDGERGAPFEARELKRELRERLPEYMVPSEIVVLGEMPLTANGKIDRRALLSLERPRAVLAEAYVAPQNEMEQAIANLWRETLRLEKVGRVDNFFDLGGHSLLMLELHTKLQETFDADLALVEMFKYPTVASLAQYLGQTRQSAPDYEQINERAARQNAAHRRQRQRNGWR